MNTNETNETDDTRYTAEWEPVAKVRKHDKQHGTLKRKVLTRGVKEYADGNLMRQAIRDLRQGYEVRLMNGDGEAFLRIFPVLGADCKRLYAAAQAMEPLSQSLGGIKPTIHHGGRAIREGEVAHLVREAYVAHAKAKAHDVPEVTPSTMVTCPKCGTTFRVGRALASGRNL